MKYVEQFDVYIDDDLVVYAECRRENQPSGCQKGSLYQLKGYKEKNGYIRFGLMVNGVKTHIPYHRVVALAFIPNPEGKPTVDHINRDRSDNRICNLRWASHKEQQDNTRYVDQGISKYGVRCCDDLREYNRRYGIERRKRSKH